jgi:hypothetical protein
MRICKPIWFAAGISSKACLTQSNFFKWYVASCMHQSDVAVYFETQNADYMQRGPIKWSLMYGFSAQLDPTSLSRLFAESGFRVLNAGATYPYERMDSMPSLLKPCLIVRREPNVLSASAPQKRFLAEWGSFHRR